MRRPKSEEVFVRSRCEYGMGSNNHRSSLCNTCKHEKRNGKVSELIISSNEWELNCNTCTHSNTNIGRRWTAHDRKKARPNSEEVLERREYEHGG